MVRVVLLFVFIALVVLVSTAAWAILPAIPRQYQPLPVDTNVFFLAYAHTAANSGPDEQFALANRADVNINGAMAAYLRYLNVNCNTSYLWVSLQGASASASVMSPFFGTIAGSNSGVGQPVFGFNYGYKGAPAMTPEQFVTWHQTTTLNAAFYVSPPLGSYDRDRLLNVSMNRWEFKPELTWAHRFGKWLAEVYGNVQLFTDNTQFLGSRTLSQDPLVGLDGHFSYDFGPRLWASFDVYQRWGGGVSIDNRSIFSSQDLTTLGVTLSGNVTASDVIYLMYDKTVSGSDRPSFETFQILYGHVW